MLLGLKESVKEWTLAFPSEFPFWELEFRWTFKSLKGDFRGSKFIGKLLESYWNIDV